jgi:hypothetical protein
MTVTIEVIRTNGSREQHVLSGPLFQSIYKLIGCDTVDVVNLRDGRVMLVDDDGYEPGPLIEHAPGRFAMTPGPARKPVNPEATKLYHSVCVPGTTHEIVGDVAIARDEDFA